MDFTDKVVLVTGASVGIGQATAIEFAVRGAKLALVARNLENLQRVAVACEAQRGNKPLVVVADLATDEGVEKTAKETLEHFGRMKNVTTIEMRSGIEIRINSGSEIERGQLGNPLTSTSSSERKAGPRAGSTIRRFGIENRIEIMIKATSGIMNAAHIHGELYLRMQRTSTHKSEDLSLSTVRLSRQLSSRSPDQSDSGNTAIAIYLRREVSVDPRLDKHNSFKKWLDVLVNNAGVGARTTIEKTDMETFDRVFRLNVRGVYDLTRRLVPALVATKGSIVNVSSISGHMVAVGSLPYSMSKAALDHFTKLIALELAPKGVRVNAVSPGITVSEFVKRLTGYNDEQYTAWLQESEKSIPMRRVAQGEHIAQAIAFLASDAAELITGVILPVDGATQLAGVGNSDILKKQIKE
ncbi:Oxidoreductase UcpA [Eumeta japonica]|uniref:Oxidoreductase UcpA n=1 Tax=Eumeta variegata TaxID=151549 RepID=A0A4C1Z0N6_EUMVA|nr:Oxidoreductase UcpA [Eumeta japonica]